MAFYLVTAKPKRNLMGELAERLRRNEFAGMKPFGRALTRGLTHARIRGDGVAVWEEEDYCRPPLAEERAAVLDTYFENLKVETVSEDRGWDRIDALPRLFPGLSHQGLRLSLRG
ncbi:MAG: hypothetical protein ACREDO_02130 [Methyloceanibacter sp.]